MAQEKMRILCPVDFDRNSLAALDLARDLVRENGGKLYVLHVIPPPDPFVISAPFILERSAHFARMRLEEIARESLGEIDYLLLVKTGKPAESIISSAGELNVHMIVMATHGRSGVPRLVLGSVAERVIRESPCPVLTSRPGANLASVRAEAATGS
jgi:nucleotide-binding universal stress UspA family protein